MNKNLKTSEEWYNIYPTPVILDPDGWDRINYEYSFNEELVTLEEFERRRMFSTCRFNYGAEKRR